MLVVVQPPIGAVEPCGSLWVEERNLWPAGMKNTSWDHLSVGFPLDFLLLVPLELLSMDGKTHSQSGRTISLSLPGQCLPQG